MRADCAAGEGISPSGCLLRSIIHGNFFARAEIVDVTGAAGAFRMVARFDRSADSGDVEFDGDELTGVPTAMRSPRRRCVFRWIATWRAI